MSVQDYIELGFLAVWIVCVVGVIVGTHIHFKNKKAEQYRVAAVHAMQKWVAFYDKQDMENPEKANGALNDTVKELQHKGYNISDQTVKDLEALREYVLTELRMKQAETGLDNTVKPQPEVSDKVDPKNIIQPTEPQKAGAANA